MASGLFVSTEIVHFGGFTAPSSCIGCERARDQLKTARHIVRELARYDDRSDYYGSTAGSSVNISKERVEGLFAADPDFANLVHDYEEAMARDRETRTVCGANGGSVEVYGEDSLQIQCAFELNT